MMSERIPCRERTFWLWLAYEFEYHYTSALRWLRHFLERLGRGPTLALWEQAFRGYDDQLLLRILEAGWEEAPERYAEEAEEGIAAFVATQFPRPVEGVSGEEARATVDCMPPFLQIRKHFPTLDMRRETTTYEALHLLRDGQACLVEEMLRQYGKAGELMVYDVLLEEYASWEGETVPVAEFMVQRAARFSSVPEEADLFSAGLEVELLRTSESEVVMRVTTCEWARYFREHHPTVGYLLSCSTDNAAYRSRNERIRLQRTTTLMEGGTECDFRTFGLPEVEE